jgi:hypothetical protein
MMADFFRHGSNPLLASAAAAIVAARPLGGPALRPAAVAGGAALFFASEYGTHRYLFHAAPSRFAFVRRLQHRLHDDHHADPADLSLLFLPPWFLGPNLAAFGFAYAALGRNRDLTASLVLGNLLGLLSRSGPARPTAAGSRNITCDITSRTSGWDSGSRIPPSMPSREPMPGRLRSNEARRSEPCSRTARSSRRRDKTLTQPGSLWKNRSRRQAARGPAINPMSLALGG